MDELYVVARSVLLDALEAIAVHHSAVILVGAQAIYLRVGEGDLAVAPYTTDGDLALDPDILDRVPPLEQALRSAGFRPKQHDSVGSWITHRATRGNPNTEVAIDLLVPAAVSPGSGRRAADLPGHDRRVARTVRGLEGAVVDANVITVEALDPNDGRAIDVRVAGPAALLLAKVFKIGEREGSTRADDKDALDVFRLLRGIETQDLGRRYRSLLADPRSKQIAREGIDLVERQFARRAGSGIERTIRSLRALMQPDEIVATCEVLTNEFLKVVRST